MYMSMFSPTCMFVRFLNDLHKIVHLVQYTEHVEVIQSKESDGYYFVFFFIVDDRKSSVCL